MATLKQFITAATLLMLAACASSGPMGTATGLVMAPEVFFDGPTRGRGVLVYPGGQEDRRLTVTSTGQMTADGTFVLSQLIRFDDGSEEQRVFRIRKRADGAYTGSLDGARGPVTIETEGAVMRLNYALEAVPLGRMEQYLYLQPDGRTVINEGTVRVLGVTVRRLHEIIERTGDPAEAS